MREVIKKNKVLLLILLIAVFLRFIKLSNLPAGVHADEIRAGWNAISIAKTGRDDRGNKFALYYNTFGDFRPTGIIYLTIPSVVIFGSNEFAIRFLPALLGALSIIPLYLLARELSKKEVAIWASFFLAVSPWHVSVSRATSEVAVSMFIVLFGLYFYTKAINKGQPSNYVFSGVLLASSYFFYHSVRILVPMFVFVLSVYFIREIIKKGHTKWAFGLVALLGLLTAVMSLQGAARGRFKQVSIFNDLDVAYELSRMPFEEGPNKVLIARLFHNKPFTYSRRFANEYTRYFSSDFFLTNIAKPGRYTTYGTGLLTYVEALIFVVGLAAILRGKASPLPLILLLVAPIPAALTTEDAPNMHRAFFMTPFIFMIEAYGVILLLNMYKKSNVLKYFILLGIFLNLIFWWHMYCVHAKYKSATSRNYGAKELSLQLNELQSDYDKIIFTNIPDSLYPWIAYFNRLNPSVFNKEAVKRDQGVWEYEKYTFTGQRCPSRDAFEKPEVKRLLVVDAVGCASESKLKERSDVEIINEIKEPDGSVVYTLWSRVVE